jgi:hypothetical protein
VSVRRDDDGSILLEGVCAAEDAESLLQLLQATPEAPLDWTQSNHLHTAVLPVILAARPKLVGRCGDLWVAEWVNAKTVAIPLTNCDS